MSARLLGLVILAALLIACGGAGVSEPTPKPGSTETPEAPSSRGIARPPDASASAAGSTVRLGIGTYCWSEPAIGGLCVDAIGPVTGSQSLSVTRGASITVLNPATTPIRAAAVNAWTAPAQPTSSLTSGDQAWSLAPNTGAGLQSTFTANEVQFAAELAPGRYIVQVSLQFMPGDVSYGLLLEVR